MNALPAPEDFERGLDLFNHARFFDAHEVLEDLWRAAPRDPPSGPNSRLHLQGMIQLAVAFHHESIGNLVGARSVLARSLRNLAKADLSFPELDLDGLRAQLAFWREYLAGSAPRPNPPQIFKRRPPDRKPTAPARI
ncbi:MAG: DUF309 domain-containing protein [Terriglobales bacterium]|jgi:predicted metal-dependent hydrolase